MRDTHEWLLLGYHCSLCILRFSITFNEILCYCNVMVKYYFYQDFYAKGVLKYYYIQRYLSI